jgi:hypothetical protein
VATGARASAPSSVPVRAILEGSAALAIACFCVLPPVLARRRPLLGTADGSDVTTAVD